MNTTTTQFQIYPCYATFCMKAEPPFSFVGDIAPVIGFFHITEDKRDCPSLLDLSPEKESCRTLICESLQKGDDLAVLLVLQKMNGDTVPVFLRGKRQTLPNGESLVCGVMAESSELYEQIDQMRKETTSIRHKLSQSQVMVNSLQIEATQDSLTSLLNAKTVRKTAKEYLSNTDNHCALMVIDIDDFKEVNDRFGHMVGDKVLTCAAQAIRNQFRSQDIVGRIGGDEFLVLMKDVPDFDIVSVRCSQVIESIRSLCYDQVENHPVTCSIGAVLSSKENNEYDELFDCADNALYRAKLLGKNRFEFVKQ